MIKALLDQVWKHAALNITHLVLNTFILIAPTTCQNETAFVRWDGLINEIKYSTLPRCQNL